LKETRPVAIGLCRTEDRTSAGNKSFCPKGRFLEEDAERPAARHGMKSSLHTHRLVIYQVAATYFSKGQLMILVLMNRRTNRDISFCTQARKHLKATRRASFASLDAKKLDASIKETHKPSDHAFVRGMALYEKAGMFPGESSTASSLELVRSSYTSLEPIKRGYLGQAEVAITSAMKMLRHIFS